MNQRETTQIQAIKEKIESGSCEEIREWYQSRTSMYSDNKEKRKVFEYTFLNRLGHAICMCEKTKRLKGYELFQELLSLSESAKPIHYKRRFVLMIYENIGIRRVYEYYLTQEKNDEMWQNIHSFIHSIFENIDINNPGNTYGMVLFLHRMMIMRNEKRYFINFFRQLMRMKWGDNTYEYFDKHRLYFRSRLNFDSHHTIAANEKKCKNFFSNYPRQRIKLLPHMNCVIYHDFLTKIYGVDTDYQSKVYSSITRKMGKKCKYLFLYPSDFELIVKK